MSIDHINLINVRSFDDTKIDLGKVTVCIGNSNEGKTNIVRSIVDVLSNKSSMESFVSHWSTEGICSFGNVDLYKGKTKSKTINQYRINKNGKSKIFDSVGKSTPDEILQHINMKPIEFDDGFNVLLNVAEQRGGQFFVDHTPSQRAKIIASVCGLSEIFIAVKESLGDERKLKNKVLVAKTINENVINDLAKFESNNDVELISNLFDDIKLKYNKLQQAEQIIDNLYTSYNLYKSVCGQVDTLAVCVNYEDMANTIIGGVNGLLGDYTWLSDTCNRVIRLDNLNKTIKQYQADIDGGENVLFDIDNQYNKLKGIFDILENIKGSWRNIKKIKNGIKLNNSQLISLENKLQQTKEELKNLQKVQQKCPVCGQDLDDNLLARVNSYGKG